jgi:glycosyltransferase involved in cell wall biosynthesis
MRILFLNPSATLGGAERCLLDLGASLRAHASSRGFELGLVTGGDGPLSEKAERMGMRIFRLPLSETLSAVGDTALIGHGARGLVSLAPRMARAGVSVPGYVLRLRSAMRAFAPSVVHSNGIKMHLLAAAASPRAPLVWHLRDFIGARPLVSRAMRALACRAAGAIAISTQVAGDARRVLPRLPVSVVHDAIDTEAFRPAGPVADLDALAGRAAPARGTVRVGLVATYARWKGQEVFLKAAQIVKASGCDGVRFYVVGGPIYETGGSQYGVEELRRMARELGVEPFVTFVPFESRVEDVFRALDVVVHASSRPEPFGRTIAEAMATGKPVVATRDSGAAELVVDGVDALVVPSRAPEPLARALLELVGSPQRRDLVGRAARDAAVKQFSLGRLAGQVLQVYRAAGCEAGD